MLARNGSDWIPNITLSVIHVLPMMIVACPGIDWVENWMVKITHHLPPVSQFVGIKAVVVLPPGHELHSVHEYWCCPPLSEVQHRRSPSPSNHLYHGTYWRFFMPKSLAAHLPAQFCCIADRPCLTFSILLLSRQTSSKIGGWSLPNLLF